MDNSNIEEETTNSSEDPQALNTVAEEYKEQVQEEESEESKTGFFRKVLETKKIYLIILIILLTITAFDLIRMFLFDDRKDFWGVLLIGHMSHITFIILLIIQLSRLDKISKLPNSQQLPKYSPSNAVVSFICSLTPLLLMVGYLDIIFGSSGDKFSLALGGWAIGLLYCLTIGIPAFFLWLVCGIIGLKTSKRKLALISLILRPILFLIIILGTIIFNTY